MNWIAVEDEAPKASETVLCFDKNGDYHLAFYQPYQPADFYRWDCDTYAAKGVTHWLRLSPPVTPPLSD